MTRDEATKKLRDAVPAWGSGAMLVDSLVAIGILKLDEPKSAFDKFRSAMDDLKYRENSVVWRDIPVALEAAGLKIVEK